MMPPTDRVASIRSWLARWMATGERPTSEGTIMPGATAGDAPSFAWVHDQLGRRGALNLTLRSLREGWLPESDRPTLRAELAKVLDEPGLKPREGELARAILAQLDESAGRVNRGPLPAR